MSIAISSSTFFAALSRASCDDALIWRYNGGSRSVALDLSGYHTPFVVTLAPVSSRISSCVDARVKRYLLRTSLISTSWTNAPSYWSRGPSNTPVAPPPPPLLVANCAVILAAMADAAAAAAAASLALFPSSAR